MMFVDRKDLYWYTREGYDDIGDFLQLLVDNSVLEAGSELSVSWIEML